MICELPGGEADSERPLPGKETYMTWEYVGKNTTLNLSG